MRWVIPLVLLVGAGAGIWFWSERQPAPQGDLDYGFDVETGDVVSHQRLGGLTTGTVAAIGIIGEVERPREPLAPDRWMSAELRLPAAEAVSGKDVLAAISRVAPIRFRSQAEMDAFESSEFELGTETGDLVHGHIFEDLARHVGFRVVSKHQFLFVYNPDNNDVFRKKLLESRKRR